MEPFWRIFAKWRVEEINCTILTQLFVSLRHVDGTNTRLTWHFAKRLQLRRFTDFSIFLSRRFERRHLVGDGMQPPRKGHLSVKFPGDSRRFAGRWRRRHGTDTPSVATLLSINKSTADVRQRPFYFSAGWYGSGLRKRNPCKVNRTILHDILTGIYQLFFILS